MHFFHVWLCQFASRTASILVAWCLTLGLLDRLRCLVVLVDHAAKSLPPLNGHRKPHALAVVQ
jgi:hypothetical protein